MVTLCATCGTTHDTPKSHPFTESGVAVFGLDAQGLRSDTPAQIGENLVERVQREGRELFAHGVLRLVDPDSVGTIEYGETRAAGNPPGRIVVEPYTGRGFVGNDPDPQKRIYIEQNSAWTKMFGTVVAVSAAARMREPDIAVGQRIHFVRAAGQKFYVRTPLGGDTHLAGFLLLHVDDVYAIIGGT